MPSANTIKYISLDNLTQYDALIKSYIDSADAHAFKFVEISGNTLNFYTDTPPIGQSAVPDYSITIPYEDMTAFKQQVTTLVGSDTGKSVRTIAAEEIAAQLIPANADASLDTLAEIADWIQSHPDDASAMNTAITALRNLVGTLPSGITATTVVGYIQELVDAEETRADAAEDALDARVTALEGAIGTENAFATTEDISALFATP